MISAVTKSMLPIPSATIQQAKSMPAKVDYVKWLPVKPAAFEVKNHQIIQISPQPYVDRLFKNLLPSLKTEDDVKMVYRAFNIAWRCHAGKMRDDNVNPYFEHVLSVAELVAKWGCGAEEISAALCHDLIEDTNVTQKQLANQLGERVGKLVQGVSKIKQLNLSDQDEIANIKKIIQYSEGDLGVIVIKIADRLHNMRTLRAKSKASAQRKAEETLNIFAVFAEALGMWSVHRELQDLSFYYLSDEYRNLYRKIKAKQYEIAKTTRDEAKNLCLNLKKTIAQDAKFAEVKVYLEKRHVYELKERMEIRNLSLADLNATDIWRICVVVPAGQNCYSVLGAIRRLYPCIPMKSKDFICRPHANGHKFLMDYLEVPGFGSGEALVQIRDEQMWQNYRVGVVANVAFDAKWQFRSSGFIRAILQYLNVKALDFNKADFYKTVRAKVHPIAVFTPIGDMLEMPFGSTVLDFAFRIHREILYHAEKAEIVRNGVAIETNLSEELKHGDRVRIITNPAVLPRTEWFSLITDPAAAGMLSKYFEKMKASELSKMGMEELDRQSMKYYVHARALLMSKLFVNFCKKYPVKDRYWNSFNILSAIARGQVMASWVIRAVREIFKQELKAAKQKNLARSPFYVRVKLDAATVLDKKGKLIPVYDLFGRLIEMGYTAPHTIKQTSDGKIIIVFSVDVYNDKLLGPIQRQQIENIAREVGEVSVLDAKEIEAYEHYMRIRPRTNIWKRIWLYFQRKKARVILEGD